MTSFWTSPMECGTVADEWSNITLDLGLEDVDASQFHKSSDSVLFQSTKLHLKTEEFFPTHFDQDMERPIPEFTFAHPQRQEPITVPVVSPHMISKPSAKPCPCCKEEIDLSLANFHSHVSQCFLNSTSEPEQQPNNGISENIKNIRDCVAQLDLRERISLMESLARLANAATTAHKSISDPTCTTHQSTLSSMAKESDHLVLSLLYANPSELQAEYSYKNKVSVKVEVPIFKSPFYPESSTPTLSPSSPIFGPKPSPVKMTDCVPTSASSRPVRTYKRKNRDIVQALTYDSSSANKLARTDL